MFRRRTADPAPVELDRVLRSAVPGAGLGAVPVLASLVIAAGAAGILEGAGVVTLPTGAPERTLVVENQDGGGSSTLVARGDRNLTRSGSDVPAAPGARTDVAVADPPPAPSRTSSGEQAPAAAARQSASQQASTPARTPVSPDTGGGGGGSQTPARPTRPPVDPGAGSTPRQANLGDGLKDTTAALASTTTATTDGLANVLGGQQSLLGQVVGGLGDALGGTVTGLGELLGNTLGASR